MFRIRNMNINDNKEVLELGKSLFRENDEVPLLRKALKNYISKFSYVIVNQNDKNNENIIGFCIVCKKFTKIYDKILNKIPNCLELSFFGINPSFQGKGLGSQCLEITLLSLYNYWLVVDKTNESAIKLYQKYGFIILKEIKDKYNPFYILLRKTYNI